MSDDKIKKRLAKINSEIIAKKSVSVTLDSDLLKEAKEVAKLQDRSLSGYLNSLLKKESKLSRFRK